MILAAGRGNRMRPLSNETPKPLLKVGGFSLIEHLIIRLSAAGFKEIIINLSYLADKIIHALGEGERYGVEIRYSKEEQEGGLETGGGIFNALHMLGERPFLVISGDIWTNYPFARLKNKPLSGLIHLVLVDNVEAHPNGDFALTGEKLSLSDNNRLTFGSIGIYHPKLFESCQPGFFRVAPLFVKAIEKGLATGEHYTGTWVNVSTPEVLAKLQ